MVSPALDKGSVPKLELDDVSVVYRGKSGTLIEAVRDVSLTVADRPGRGEIVVFLGPSGCGKSSILKAVAGLHRPSTGRVLCDGVEVQGPSQERGMVFQQYTSFPWLTVVKNVEYGLKLAGVAAAERRRRALETLGKVGLADFANQYPKSLSGGMKQRVAIARTLVSKPRFILMDEPFGALDPFTRWEMQSLILELSRTEECTILFVTHDVEEAVYVGDTIFILSPRPARVLHQIEVPFFEEREPKLKATDAFREAEALVLKLMLQAGGRT